MLTDAGPRLYKQSLAAATLSFSPLNDRAAVVKRLYVDKPSAGDIWRVKMQGFEAGAFDLQTFGHQQPLSGPYSAFPNTNDIFDVYELLTGEQLIYPVPMGQTLTIASDGGATADIMIEYSEYQPNELSPGMMNHPKGNRIVCPVVGYVNAAVTAAGEAKFDTQVGPTWFPNIFADGELPPNWRFNILSLFLEGGGRNAYAASTDHQSYTTYVGVRKNGQVYYTRESTGGIPLYGQASAAGSANTVVGNDLTPFPAFQDTDLSNYRKLDYPFTLDAGNSYQFRLNVAGDVGAGADFSHMRQLFLCDVRTG